MIREEAIRVILAHLDQEIVIAANGMISREAMVARDRPENFYMIGSMGLASSIGLGLALSRPERRVVVLDGDGNLLMNLGVLPTASFLAPANFIHVLLDNAVHGSTGNQPTLSGKIPLEEMATAAGYRVVERASRREEIEAAMPRLLDAPGPAFLLIRLDIGDRGEEVPRVPLSPEAITARLRRVVAGTD
ncbi:MAG: thiamine pyrophosphate-dependent enzyme [Candidatus Methylomirabilales bacterium]